MPNKNSSKKTLIVQLLFNSASKHNRHKESLNGPCGGKSPFSNWEANNKDAKAFQEIACATLATGKSAGVHCSDKSNRSGFAFIEKDKKLQMSIVAYHASVDFPLKESTSDTLSFSSKDKPIANFKMIVNKEDRFVWEAEQGGKKTTSIYNRKKNK